MGKCLSSNRKPKLAASKNVEERPYSPLPETPARPDSEAEPPVYLISSIPSPMAKPKASYHKCTSAISFESLSPLRLEKEMLQRIADSLHRLSAAYQQEGSYHLTIDHLQLAAEIYLHLSQFVEYNEVGADLLLAYLVTETEAPIPYFREPVDERTALLRGAYLHATSTDLSTLLHKAAKLSRFHQTELNLSKCLLEVGHLFRIWLNMPSEALACYREARDRDRSNAQVRFYLALAYKKLGDPVRAANSYLKGIELDPEFCDCYFNLGNLHFDHYQDYSGAYKCYKAALGAYGTQDSLATLGRIYCMLAETCAKLDRPQHAFRALLKGIRYDPWCLDCYRLCGTYAAQLGRTDLAVACQTITSIFQNEAVNTVLSVEDEADCRLLRRAVRRLLRLLNNSESVQALTTGQQQSVKRQFHTVSSEQVATLAEVYQSLAEYS